MDALVVVDMQVGLLRGDATHDLRGVLDRINRLAALVRRRFGRVVWIQHRGAPGDDFEPDTTGWALLPDLDRQPADLVVHKTLNDPFAGTGLQATLESLAPDRILVTGWATDFCVDATVRSAVSNNHHVVVVSDGHTLSDRPHLDAATVIRHHNWIWSNLLTNRSVKVMSAAALLAAEAPAAAMRRTADRPS
jgi:nicotinamidase-related amidase